MIRVLQQNNQVVKTLFAVIIGFAVVTMVITLVPGIYDAASASGSSSANFATVQPPGFFGRFAGETVPVTLAEVSRAVQQQTQGRPVPEYILPMFESRAGEQLVQGAILKIEADKMGLQVSDADLARELHQGQLGQLLFPGGKYIGGDAYRDFLQNRLNMTVPEFESLVKRDMEVGRLQALVTGGVTVSDAAVRESLRSSALKVKFDYAVVLSDDIAKTVNPSDADLQAFFKQNATRYANALPETRQLEYATFGVDQIPGGKPLIAESDVQAYYNAHQASYQVKAQAKARHILIAVPDGADAKADAAARAKADNLLKQITAGGNFAALASANSDDPGSKTQGGELPPMGRGQTVPEFDKALFTTLKPGETSGVIKTKFGYHIIQLESRDEAHLRPMAEVRGEIVPLLEQTRVGAAEQSFANTLVAEAHKVGLEKTAAAHGLHTVKTDYLGRDGTVAGVADGANMLTLAFAAHKGDSPLASPTGDGYALFQVLDIKPAHAPTFEEYKSHLVSDYREQQVPQRLNAEMTKLADRAKALGDLRKAAAEMNIAVKTSDLIGKDGQVPDLGALSGAAAKIFTLPKGGISAAFTVIRGAAVAEVVDVAEPDAAEIAKSFDATHEQLLNAKREEVFRVYLGTLTDKYKAGGGVRLAKAPAEPGVLGAPKSAK